MSHDSLRAALRAYTSEAHQRLDDTVGALSSVESYRTFVVLSHAFRSAVEPTLQPLPDWIPLKLTDELRADIDDMNCTPMHIPAIDPAPNWSANLGRLYVVEGSSVGARLLYNAARKLSFSEKHGARHLAVQAGDIARWKQFSNLLDTIEGVDRSEAMAGARQLFEFAITIYSGKGS